MQAQDGPKPPILIDAPIKLKQNATYSIIAPGKLVPNAEYRITVFVVNATSDTNVDAEIVAVHNNQTKEDIVAKASATVPNGKNELLVIDVGDLTAGTYKLRVSGKGGVEFKHENTIYLESKNILFFVQTDKAMYKPGQMVRFRYITTNQNLIPMEGINVTVIVKDTNGNVINKYIDKTPENGVVSHDLLLSDQPLLGDWSIEFSTDSNKASSSSYTKRFTIAEYILPTFDVSIKLPPFTTVNSTTFPATVKATYTYGKPVKGDVIFTVSDSTYSYHVYNYLKRVLVKYVSTIDGEITFPIEVKDFLGSGNVYSSKSFNVDASVKDSVTGRVYNKTSTLTVYENKYKFEFLKSSRKFIQGVAYTAYIKIAHPDDTPVPNDGKPVKLTYYFGYRDNKNKREITAVPENGVIKVNLDTTPFEKPPKEITTKLDGATKTVYTPEEDDTSSMKVDAEYDGVKANVGYIYKTTVSDVCFTQLQLAEDQLDKDFKVGDTVKLELITSKNSIFKPNMVYEINKKGMHLNALVIPRIDHPAEHLPFKKESIQFKLDLDDAPKVRFLIHGLCGKSIIAESVDIDVDGVMRTPVNVTTNIGEAKPGADIEVLVNTKPNSAVGLLGIDQQMLLLRDGHDISKKDINEGAKKYMGCNGNSDFSSCAPRHHWYGNDPTPWEIRRSGLILFSNLPVFTEYHSISSMTTTKRKQGISRPLAAPASSPRPIPAQEAQFDSEANRGGSVQRMDFKPRLRKHFPETWIWQMVDADQSGKSAFKSKVPDTITSFLISAFAVKVFRPFFVKLGLPYSVIRGETIALQATVYNYLKGAQNVKVTLDNTNKEFEFAVADETNDLYSQDGSKTKTITIAPNDGVAVSFLIKPKKLGYIAIKVSALSEEAGDEIEQRLLVKPEGETHYKNKAFLITSEANDGKVEKKVEVEMPQEIVEGSERVSVTAIGDVLGPAINNLDDLLRMPYGCGEQNMIRLVPNVVVLKYLTEAKRLQDNVKTKAIANIETGYQRQLTYKHFNGSFSAFGREDKSGSTWLSAFVFKSFVQAKPFATIDQKVINETLAFLLSTQREDGSFVEIAEQYLVKILGETSDVYEVAIITHALHMFDSKDKDNAFKKLNSLATKTPDYTYWSTNSSVKNLYGNVEMTSYALMTYVIRGQFEDALPILRYLISQQNSKGGFMSTQDTVIGLQALGSFAGKVSAKEVNMKITIKGDNAEDAASTFDINKDNAIVLNNALLNKNTKSVDIKANGQGTVLMQVSTQYNQLKGSEKPAFEIKSEIDESSTENTLKLKLCTKFLAGKESGMTVMEITLPSGFSANVDSLDDIKKLGAKRVELKDGNTKVVVYFDKITDSLTCINLVANRDAKLANLKPVPVTVYDYYDKTKTATVFYEPKQQKTCDICEGEDCSANCKK
ncbi:CD109 antigen-like protein [Leptotrombidium deliense]|uniref:TEP1-F n=1 Tax=Leptotrombidium deliense TaxID=299467 RepID=A0A443SS49_9ACAR|nr:CD109 antigen-like protein [Leptotrombidium deliense]